MEGFVSVSEAAKMKNLSTGHIRMLCITGKLEGVQKLGKVWVIPKKTIEEYTPGPQGYAAYWQRKKAQEVDVKNKIQKAIMQSKGMNHDD